MHVIGKKLVVILIALTMQLSFATQLRAQSSLDTRAPVIELNPVAQTQADATQSFTAQVVDNVQLKDVALYCRRSGQLPFTSALMRRLGESAYFAVSIETDPEDLRAIEYYIQARDESGNRTVEGFAFDPYTLELLPSETPLATATESTPDPSVTATPAQTEQKSALSGLSLDKVRWWHIAGGVLLAGAVASLASSGGGSSGGDSGDTVPLTVNLTGP